MGRGKIRLVVLFFEWFCFYIIYLLFFCYVIHVYDSFLHFNYVRYYHNLLVRYATILRDVGYTPDRLFYLVSSVTIYKIADYYIGFYLDFYLWPFLYSFIPNTYTVLRRFFYLYKINPVYFYFFIYKQNHSRVFISISRDYYKKVIYFWGYEQLITKWVRSFKNRGFIFASSKALKRIKDNFIKIILDWHLKPIMRFFKQFSLVFKLAKNKYFFTTKFLYLNFYLALAIIFTIIIIWYQYFFGYITYYLNKLFIFLPAPNVLNYELYRSLFSGRRNKHDYIFSDYNWYKNHLYSPTSYIMWCFLWCSSTLWITRHFVLLYPRWYFIRINLFNFIIFLISLIPYIYYYSSRVLYHGVLLRYVFPSVQWQNHPFKFILNIGNVTLLVLMLIISICCLFYLDSKPWSKPHKEDFSYLALKILIITNVVFVYRDFRVVQLLIVYLNYQIYLLYFLQKNIKLTGLIRWKIFFINTLPICVLIFALFSLYSESMFRTKPDSGFYGGFRHWLDGRRSHVNNFSAPLFQFTTLRLNSAEVITYIVACISVTLISAVLTTKFDTINLLFVFFCTSLFVLTLSYCYRIFTRNYLFNFTLVNYLLLLFTTMSLSLIWVKLIKRKLIIITLLYLLILFFNLFQYYSYTHIFLYVFLVLTLLAIILSFFFKYVNNFVNAVHFLLNIVIVFPGFIYFLKSFNFIWDWRVVLLHITFYTIIIIFIIQQYYYFFWLRGYLNLPIQPNIIRLSSIWINMNLVVIFFFLLTYYFLLFSIEITQPDVFDRRFVYEWKFYFAYFTILNSFFFVRRFIRLFKLEQLLYFWVIYTVLYLLWALFMKSYYGLKQAWIEQEDVYTPLFSYKVNFINPQVLDTVITLMYNPKSMDNDYWRVNNADYDLNDQVGEHFTWTLNYVGFIHRYYEPYNFWFVRPSNLERLLWQDSNHYRLENKYERYTTALTYAYQKTLTRNHYHFFYKNFNNSYTPIY